MAEQLVHLEHVDLALLEYSLHLVVAPYLALVIWVLKFVCFYIFPQFLDYLGSR